MRKKRTLFLILLAVAFTAQAKVQIIENVPDSAYIFSYATTKNRGHNGMHFAWSTDRENWHPIGPEHSYLRCDYGRWGAEKRMLSPVLIRDKEGLWHSLWSLNEQDGAFAHAASADLVSWRRQLYPFMLKNNNCMNIETGYNTAADHYVITWVSTASGQQSIYSTTTRDFKNYTPAQQVPEAARWNQRDIVEIGGTEETGTIHKVEWNIIEGLIKAQQLAAYKNQLYGEMAKDDPVRFAGLKPLKADIKVNTDASKPISDLLIGIFFEDINYAADGGLYAELVQNRGFEYSPADKEGRDKNWNQYTAWSLKGVGATFTIDTVTPLHINNKHYALLKINQPGAALVNEGFDGIVLKAGDKYNLSLFARLPEGRGGRLTIRLADAAGNLCGQTTVRGLSSSWKKHEAVITASKDVADARLEIIPEFTGSVALDMISLFPQKTFKGRRNGLRADLAQTLADMKPRFVRFPGGCVAHGDGLGNIYRWENTIGPLEARKPQRNLWGYHQTAGLGYFEYFQFCEDIGAEPVPVVAAGVPCQNSARGACGGGQQCGIPMSEMGDYIQQVLNLIEWANGDAKTGWGKKRAEAGHPKPFNLKYIGVGNEDLITDVFEERFTMIFNAVKGKYPEITVIGTVGPFYEGTDYEEGWDLATRLHVPMVDEHYYVSPAWLIYNQDYYDKYDRNKSKVYLGEYAAHLPGRPNNIETALAEALYMTTLERNGDVVSMTSYAPLLAKEGHTQWNPDLIYFNNTEVKPTVGYYVQQLYGNNAGDEYLPASISLSEQREAVKKRVAISTVRDSCTGDIIVKLVNLLPVSVETAIDIPGLDTNATQAIKTVLQGKPNDRTARPVTTGFTVSAPLQVELPAYSFTVLRMKQQQQKK